MARVPATDRPSARNRARRSDPAPDAFLTETRFPQDLSNYRSAALEQAPLPSSADEKWLYERTRVAA